MKLLMISTDRKVLDQNSDVSLRLLMLRESFEDLRILLVSKKVFSNKARNIKGLFIYEMSFWRAFFWTPNFSLDFVTTQDPFENGLLGWCISRKINKPLQLQVHTDFLSPLFKKESLKNRIRVLLAKFLIPKADSIRVVSQRIRESLILGPRFKNLESKIKILSVFVDREKLLKQQAGFSLREKFHEFDKFVLMVSRLEKEKNIDLAIKAIKLVVEKNSKIGLVVCGEGSLRNNLQDLVRSLGLETNVKFLGFVIDKSAVYKSADLLLVTSSYEGYGMNMVEASVFNLPVVATDVGVAKELGATIVTLDERDISEKIFESLNNLKKSKDHYLIYSKEEYLKAYKMGFDISKL